MGVTPRKLQYIREAGNRNGVASREEWTLGVAIQSIEKRQDFLLLFFEILPLSMLSF
jgi:hypothetical protein